MNFRRHIFEKCHEYLSKQPDKIQWRFTRESGFDIDPFILPASVISQLRSYAAQIIKLDKNLTTPMKNAPFSATEMRRWRVSDLLAFRTGQSIALPVELLPDSFAFESTFIDRCARCVASGIAPGGFIGYDTTFAPYECSSHGTWDGLQPVFEASEADKATIASGKASFVFLSLDKLAVDKGKHAAVISKFFSSKHINLAIKQYGTATNSDDPLLDISLPDERLQRVVTTPRYSAMSLMLREAYDVQSLLKWQDENPNLYFIVIDHLRWFDFYALRDLLLYPLRIIGTIGGSAGITGIAMWRERYLLRALGLEKSKFVILDTKQALHFRHRFVEHYNPIDYANVGSCSPVPLVSHFSGNITSADVDGIKEQLDKSVYPNSIQALVKSPVQTRSTEFSGQSCFWKQVKDKVRILQWDKETFKQYNRAKRAVVHGIE